MPSTNWKEVVAPDEKERFAAYTEQVKAIQAKRGQPARGFHPKSLGAAKARFEVHGGLPPHAQHGLFAKPAAYDAWVRFSNGAIKTQDDRKGDVRGCAVKVLGVSGKKIYGEAGTQDFSMIQVPKLAFKNADEFMWFVAAASRPASLLPRLIGRFGLRAFSILASLPKGILAPIPSLATTQFFSPMAVQCGPYAVRYCVKPTNGEPPRDKGKSANYLTEDLTQRLAAGPLQWEFLLQFFESEERTPIEDTSRTWDTPHVHVATLTLPQQDLVSEAAKKLAADVEAHSFNPWHALVEHRPLGDMMRARDPAYFASTTARGTSPEP